MDYVFISMVKELNLTIKNKQNLFKDTDFILYIKWYMKWVSIIDTIIKTRSKNICINTVNVKVEFNKMNIPNNEVIKIIKNNTILLFIDW